MLKLHFLHSLVCLYFSGTGTTLYVANCSKKIITIAGSQRGIWNQGSRAKKRVGSGSTAPGSGITTPGIGISGVSHWMKDQAFRINKILRDKGSKFSSRLEPGIKNLGKITGSAMKKYTSLRPCDRRGHKLNDLVGNYPSYPTNCKKRNKTLTT